MATKVLVDNGHGANTPGKHSPDMRLREYAWAREIAKRVVDGLKAKGVDAQLLTPEQYDVSISTRAIRANRWCVERGTKNVVVVSIHSNAAGSDNQWHSAKYWSAWVYREVVKKAGKIVCIKEASAASKRLATIFSEGARKRGWQVSRNERGDYQDANFGILRETMCPAVLTENFFQDNKENVAFLLSEDGKKQITDLHIECILKYIGDAKDTIGK